MSICKICGGVMRQHIDGNGMMATMEHQFESDKQRCEKLKDRDCARCMYVSASKKKHCYTLTRLLKKKLADRPLAPEYVLPILAEIPQECKRYTEKIQSNGKEILCAKK